MPILILVGVVVLLGVVIVWNDRRFDRMVQAEIAALFSRAARGEPKRFSAADLEGLPDPVQRYLRRCLKEGQPYMQTTRLKQRGEMRLGADKPWKPFEAEQYFTSDPPAFVWRVRLAFLPLVWVVGRDRYGQGEGSMVIKVLSALTVVNAHGSKTASGSFIRYLAELMWMPTAFIHNPYIQWQAIDAVSASATARDGGVEAAVTFHFDEQGDISHLVSETRYMGEADERPTRWLVYMREYRSFNDVRIPAVCEVGWEPETGYYAWWRGTITHLESNVGTAY